MRTIYIDVTVRLTIQMEEGIEVQEVIELDYNFNSETEGADVVDQEITGQEIQDSK
jgi:hypothetical protein